MKPSTFLLALFLSFFSFQIHDSAQAMEKRYEMKSGMIRYQFSGMRTGQEILYFDDYGKREARYTQATADFMGFTTDEKTVHILDGEWSCQIDMLKRTGTKVSYKEIVEGIRLGNRESMMKAKQFSEELLFAMGATALGTENILGRKATIYEIAGYGIRVYVWKGLVLRYQMNFMGLQFEQMAIEVKENASVSPKEFEIPNDIVIEEINLTEEEVQQMGASAQGFNQAINQWDQGVQQTTMNPQGLTPLQKARLAQQEQIARQQMPTQEEMAEAGRQAQQGLAFLGAMAQQYSQNVQQNQAATTANLNATPETTAANMLGSFLSGFAEQNQEQ